MIQPESSITKTKKKPYFICTRCKNNTLKPGGTVIPCPRGSCEAEEIGELVTTITHEIFFKYKIK